MSKTYIGQRKLGRTEEGGFHVFIEDSGGQKPLDPALSQKIVNHSPDGFNWGYGGSGPSQLALGILFDVTGDKNLSIEYYHDFKEECVRGMPDQWKLKEVSVREWINKKLYEELNKVLDKLSQESTKTKYQGVESELVAEKILNDNWNSYPLFEVIRRLIEYEITKLRLEGE